MRTFPCLVLVLNLVCCCLFSCRNPNKQPPSTTIAVDSIPFVNKNHAAVQTRQLKDGTYCFKNYNSPGYEYLTFTVAAGRITNGSGDGHTESEEVSWIFSFNGFFEEDGIIRVEVEVENESGVQTPRLETWKVDGNGLLQVKRGENRVVAFKKVPCE